MARVIFGSYLVRYPLGGMMSHVLQYLVGLTRLGHDVTFVEKAGYAEACFDPSTGCMTDDCSYGTQAAEALLGRYGLGGRWCYVDAAECYHGLDQADVEFEFARADVFLDMGTHGAWLDEASETGVTVLIDGEPGYNQVRMLTGDLDPGMRYDFYVTNGRNVGTSASCAPTAGRIWRHIFHPVVPDLIDVTDPAPGAPFSTVMNWRSHGRIDYDGVIYGQKDVEFEKFIDLPRLVNTPMELAASGNLPEDRLKAAGWRLRGGHAVTRTYDSFCAYAAASAGEFSVAKNIFVAMNTGWFSDRSAVYLAAGRPVVMQDTGFSDHLPTGRGLFAVRSADEAAAAIEAIRAEPQSHAAAARAIALDYLDATTVLGSLLDQIGVPRVSR